MNQSLAISQQQVAARRHEWTVEDRTGYIRCRRYDDGRGVYECRVSFIRWSGERAEYARAAMKEMGVTDEDQYYA